MALKIKSFICCAKHLPRKNLKFIHTSVVKVQSEGVTRSTFIDLRESTSTVEQEIASVNAGVLVNNEACDLTSSSTLEQEIVSTFLLENNQEQQIVHDNGRHFLYPRLSQTTFVE